MEKKYAGFWWRFIAIIIDGIIMWLIQLVLLMPFMGVIGITAFKASTDSMSEVQALGYAGAILGTLMLTILLMIVAGWLYYSLMESSKYQATIGKITIGLIVTDIDGNRISFGRATARYFGKILSAMILYVGFMMAGFTDKKQALHDILASTLVWKK